MAILTMGDRPAELRRAIASARRQSMDVEVVVVENSTSASLDAAVVGADVLVHTGRNLGIPGGRNVAAERASGELILFLDDDAELVDDGLLERASERFCSEPSLGAIALRIVDETGTTARRHVPRIGGRTAETSGYVAGFLGGAVIVRSAAFERVGCYDAALWYAMEETDLAWRLIDGGWAIWYESTPAALHPRTEPARHPGHVERTARNRVRIGWRSLPLPLFGMYVGTWLVIGACRRSSPAAMWSGTLTGWADRPADRVPMSWRTVWRLTRLGRPPIV